MMSANTHKSFITSVSTAKFIPQPVDNKEHFIRNRIFVANFPSSASQKDIIDAFQFYGEIIATKIIDSSDGNSRYGFVTFKSIVSANTVLSLHSKGNTFFVKGHPVNVNRAVFKPKKQSGKLTSNDKTYEQTVLNVHGQPIVTEYINGTAYFKPLKDSGMPTILPMSIKQKPPHLTPYLPIPHFAMINPCNIPMQTNLPHCMPIVDHVSKTQLNHTIVQACPLNMVYPLHSLDTVMYGPNCGLPLQI